MAVLGPSLGGTVACVGVPGTRSRSDDLWEGAADWYGHPVRRAHALMDAGMGRAGRAAYGAGAHDPADSASKRGDPARGGAGAVGGHPGSPAQGDQLALRRGPIPVGAHHAKPYGRRRKVGRSGPCNDPQSTIYLPVVTVQPGIPAAHCGPRGPWSACWPHRRESRALEAPFGIADSR